MKHLRSPQPPTLSDLWGHHSSGEGVVGEIVLAPSSARKFFIYSDSKSTILPELRKSASGTCLGIEHRKHIRQNISPPSALLSVERIESKETHALSAAATPSLWASCVGAVSSLRVSGAVGVQALSCNLIFQPAQSQRKRDQVHSGSQFCFGKIKSTVVSYIVMYPNHLLMTVVFHS